MKPNLSNRYNNLTQLNSTNSKTQTVDVTNNNYSSYKNYGCYLVKMSQNVKNKSLSKSKYTGGDNSNVLARIKIKDKKDERHMKTQGVQYKQQKISNKKQQQLYSSTKNHQPNYLNNYINISTHKRHHSLNNNNNNKHKKRPLDLYISTIITDHSHENNQPQQKQQQQIFFQIKNTQQSNFNTTFNNNKSNTIKRDKLKKLKTQTFQQNIIRNKLKFNKLSINSQQRFKTLSDYYSTIDDQPNTILQQSLTSYKRYQNNKNNNKLSDIQTRQKIQSKTNFNKTKRNKNNNNKFFIPSLVKDKLSPSKLINLVKTIQDQQLYPKIKIKTNPLQTLQKRYSKMSQTLKQSQSIRFNIKPNTQRNINTSHNHDEFKQTQTRQKRQSQKQQLNNTCKQQLNKLQKQQLNKLQKQQSIKQSKQYKIGKIVKQQIIIDSRQCISLSNNHISCLKVENHVNGENIHIKQNRTLYLNHIIQNQTQDLNTAIQKQKVQHNSIENLSPLAQNNLTQTHHPKQTHFQNQPHQVIQPQRSLILKSSIIKLKTIEIVTQNIFINIKQNKFINIKQSTKSQTHLLIIIQQTSTKLLTINSKRQQLYHILIILSHFPIFLTKFIFYLQLS